jgi:hypothetical protein
VRRRAAVVARRHVVALLVLGALGGALLAVSTRDEDDRRDERTRGASPGEVTGPVGAQPEVLPLAERIERIDRRFRVYARRAGGETGLAIAPVGSGDLRALGRLRQGRAWSAMKVPLLVAILRWRREEAGTADGVPRLSGSERRHAERALTRSSNLAARALFRELAEEFGVDGARRRLQRVFTVVGDDTTRVSTELNPETGLTNFGITEWRLEDGVRFFRALARGCLLSPDDTAYVLDLMRRPRRRSQWGLIDAFPPGAVAMKAGWGPDDDLRWLVSQFAIVGTGPDAVVVGAMVRPRRIATSEADPDSYYAGRRMLRTIGEMVRLDVGVPAGTAEATTKELCR